jgi:hypothetical protein
MFHIMLFVVTMNITHERVFILWQCNATRTNFTQATVLTNATGFNTQTEEQE